LPRSLHSMADVRAARTEEKVGHSGRDDRMGRGVVASAWSDRETGISPLPRGSCMCGNDWG
jgi:hypothetical protein